MTHPYCDQTGIHKMREVNDGSEMERMCVIYLIDSIGEEFFITQEDESVRVNAHSKQNSLVVDNFFQLRTQLSRLRKKHSSTCQLFALEYGEFLERKEQ